MVAQNAKLKVEVPDTGFRLAHVYGYNHERSTLGPVVDFNDVFSEETKAVLIEFDVGTDAPSVQFKVRLEYDDVDKSFRKQAETLGLNLAKAAGGAEHEKGKDDAVVRNVVLFRSIETFEKAMKHVDEQQWDKAMLRSNKAFMDESFAKVKPDSVLLKQYEQNDKYAKDLAILRTRSQAERSIYQKSSKSSSCSLKKKR